MRIRTLLALGLLLAHGRAQGAPRDCRTTATKALVACVAGASGALRACARRQRSACTTDATAARAGVRLRRAVTARCTPATIEQTGYPPPFDAAVLATRLEASCLATAGALVARGVDLLGQTRPGACFTTLVDGPTRVAVRTLAATAACTLAGDTCRTDRMAARIDAVTHRVIRVATRRCAANGLTDAGIGALVARTRAQASCVLGDTLPTLPRCAPTTADALVDLWRLPVPRPAGTRLAQVSSYDRLGGNADLGIGPDTAPLLAALGLPTVQLDYSYLYRDGDRYVVFDELGPGVVWRIWMTGLDALLAGGLAGDIAFEVDGEATARLQLARADLFAGTTPPFLPPLAGDRVVSSGGFYSVVPIAFARGLRISTSTVPNWLQITFARLPPDQVPAGFAPAADLSAVAARLAQAGDPATTITPTTIDDTPLAIAPGTSASAWSRLRAGTIVRLELSGPPGTDVPVGLRLRATFDDAATPQVDAPLDDLFGASLGPGARSIAFGRAGDRFYCYFPMPFRQSARLEVRNDGDAPFTGWSLHVGTVDALPPGPPTHFHATARAAHLAPDANDYVLLDRRGAGHVVGIVMTVGCGAAGQCQLPNIPGLDGSHLEGDERVTLDDGRWPQWHGTGLEDLFGGGFYFVNGPFTLPTHGNPAQAPATTPRRAGLNLRSTYRVLTGDAITYEAGIHLAIEHGPGNDVPADFSSVVFHYARAAATLVQSDRLLIGDGASEAAHALASEDRAPLVATSAFRGDDSDRLVAATGMRARRTRFQVTVDPANRGVRLGRWMDLAGGRQAARVLVDGVPAGVWQTAEVNPFLRWAEVDFELPAALTAGRATLQIDLDAAGSPTPWTAFAYTAASHLE